MPVRAFLAPQERPAAQKVCIAKGGSRPRPIFFFLIDAKTKIGAEFFPNPVPKFVLRVSAICTVGPSNAVGLGNLYCGSQ